MLTEHHLKCLTTNSHGAYPRHGQDFARYDTLDITSRTGGRYLNRKYMIIVTKTRVTEKSQWCDLAGTGYQKGNTPH